MSDPVSGVVAELPVGKGEGESEHAHQTRERRSAPLRHAPDASSSPVGPESGRGMWPCPEPAIPSLTMIMYACTPS